MAQKRMFDKAIIDTDKFMDLPMSSKALYFLLGMEADDEGFVSPRKIIRLHGGTDDDIKILTAKGFVIPFDSGVVVITDWHTNNYLNKHRTKPTQYVAEKSALAVVSVGDNQNSKDKKYVLTGIKKDGLNVGSTDVQPEEKRREEKSIEEYSHEFMSFWESYPRKIGKVAAYKVWKRVKLPPLDVVLLAVETQKKSKQWQADHGQYIPHPATWLNQGRWEDELETALPDEVLVL